MSACCTATFSVTIMDSVYRLYCTFMMSSNILGFFVFLFFFCYWLNDSWKLTAASKNCYTWWRNTLQPTELKKNSLSWPWRDVGWKFWRYSYVKLLHHNSGWCHFLKNNKHFDQGAVTTWKGLHLKIFTECLVHDAVFIESLPGFWHSLVH